MAGSPRPCCLPQTVQGRTKGFSRLLFLKEPLSPPTSVPPPLHHPQLLPDQALLWHWNRPQPWHTPHGGHVPLLGLWDGAELFAPSSPRPLLGHSPALMQGRRALRIAGTDLITYSILESLGSSAVTLSGAHLPWAHMAGQHMQSWWPWLLWLGRGHQPAVQGSRGMSPKALRPFSQDGGQAGTLMQGETITFSLDAGRGQSSACAAGDTQGTEEWPRYNSS